jgi:hypothetical protein
MTTITAGHSGPCARHIRCISVTCAQLLCTGKKSTVRRDILSRFDTVFEISRYYDGHRANPANAQCSYTPSFPLELTTEKPLSGAGAAGKRIRNKKDTGRDYFDLVVNMTVPN